MPPNSTPAGNDDLFSLLRGCREHLSVMDAGDPRVNPSKPKAHALIERIDAQLILLQRSKIDRQRAVVAYAKAIGFESAGGAYWDQDAPDCAFTSCGDALVEHPDPQAGTSIDLGVYLRDAIFARMEASTFDIHGDPEDTRLAIYDHHPNAKLKAAPASA